MITVEYMCSDYKMRITWPLLLNIRSSLGFRKFDTVVLNHFYNYQIPYITSAT